MVKLSSLMKFGKKAVEKIDEKTIDKVAAKVKGIDPGAFDKVAGKAGKVVGQKRAQAVAEKAKGFLEDEKIDALAGKAKGFVGKDGKAPSASGATAPAENDPPPEPRSAAD